MTPLPSTPPLPAEPFTHEAYTGQQQQLNLFSQIALPEGVDMSEENHNDVSQDEHSFTTHSNSNMQSNLLIDAHATDNMQMIVAPKTAQDLVRNFIIPEEKQHLFDVYGSREQVQEEVTEFQQVMNLVCRNRCPQRTDENGQLSGFVEYYCVQENVAYCLDCAHNLHDDDDSPFHQHQLYRKTEICAYKNCGLQAQVRCQQCDCVSELGLMLCALHASGIHQRGQFVYHSPQMLTLKEQFPVSCQETDASLRQRIQEIDPTLMEQGERYIPVVVPSTQHPYQHSMRSVHEDESDSSSSASEKKRKPEDLSLISKQRAKRMRVPYTRKIVVVFEDPEFTDYVEQIACIRDYMDQIRGTVDRLLNSTWDAPFIVNESQGLAHLISGLLLKSGLLRRVDRLDVEQITIPDYITHTNFYANSYPAQKNSMQPIRQKLSVWIKSAPQQICALLGNFCSFRYQLRHDRCIVNGGEKTQAQCVQFFGPTYLCSIAILLLKVVIHSAECMLDCYRSDLRMGRLDGLQPRSQHIVRHGTVSAILVTMHHTITDDIALKRSESDLASRHRLSAGSVLLQDYYTQISSHPKSGNYESIDVSSEDETLFYTGFDFIAMQFNGAELSTKAEKEESIAASLSSVVNYHDEQKMNHHEQQYFHSGAETKVVIKARMAPNVVENTTKDDATSGDTAIIRPLEDDIVDYSEETSETEGTAASSSDEN